ncbi:hypothetical protein HDU76_006123, partial [Blyttiomyces sp. JEL0837]
MDRQNSIRSRQASVTANPAAGHHRAVTPSGNSGPPQPPSAIGTNAPPTRKPSASVINTNTNTNASSSTPGAGTSTGSKLSAGAGPAANANMTKSASKLPVNLNSIMKQTGKKTRVAMGTPLFGFGQIKQNRFVDIVRYLIERKLGKNKKANRLWSILREHVRQGFFQSTLSNTDPEASDFLTLVDNLWNDVHKHAPDAASRNPSGPDSTTDFVLAGWAKIKAEQYAFARIRAKRSMDNLAFDFNIGKQGGGGRRDSDAGSLDNMRVSRAVRGGDEDNEQPSGAGIRKNSGGAGMILGAGRSSLASDRGDRGGMSYNIKAVGGDISKSGDDDVGSSEDDSEFGTHGRGSMGIEGLSFDTVPNLNVSRSLKKIAAGLQIDTIVDADFYTVQVHFNRAWKLLLLGLTQAESFARYMAMCSLKTALPMINDTLLDSATRENLFTVLINLMISDERNENRLKAVYLLGQLGSQLGSVREHDHLLLKAFKELAKKLLELQYMEKLDQNNQQRHREENRALKIYLFHAIGKFARYVNRGSSFIEDLLIYMLYEEFSVGDTKVSIKNAVDKKAGGPIFVTQSLLRVLVHELKHTEANEKYIGAMFKGFVHPLMKIPHQGLQMLAVQFISNWLPIVNEDAVILGLEALEAGLEHTKSLNVRNFNKDLFETELRNLKKRRITEESRMAVRAKLLLLELLSVSLFTPNQVFLSRGHYLRFQEQSWAEKLAPPKYKYEYLERIGRIPGLPFGYTYCPSHLIDAYAMKGIDKGHKKLTKDGHEDGGRNSQDGGVVVTQGGRPSIMAPKPGGGRLSTMNRGLGPRRPSMSNQNDFKKGSILSLPIPEDDIIIAKTRGSVANPAMAKLLIAAAGEARRASGMPSPSGVEAASFGFVKRRSTQSKI